MGTTILGEEQSFKIAAPANDFIVISPLDNVAIALGDICEGTLISTTSGAFAIKELIKKGHKFAIAVIPTGANVIKYGFSIGLARQNIDAGQLVHTHNIESGLESSIIEGAGNRPIFTAPNHTQPSIAEGHFMGFARPDGGVGIRNEIWIIPTVGCVSALCARLAHDFDTKNTKIDGVYALPHQFGCSQLGDDLSATKNLIASLVCHPNAGGVLIIGLGCENNRLANLIEAIPPEYRYKIRHFEAQKVGDEFTHGKALLAELAILINKQSRVKQNARELIIGVKCGGSDGFSGLSANPLIGRISSYFESLGAKIIMSEIPEIFGAEQILYNRCASREVFDKLEATIEKFKDYFKQNGQKIYENPSPGNKEGGISTLEEKSIGAVQKGGGAIITDVLEYTARVKNSGLNILNAPGNDAISSTALAASGAHIILFSTGRGTPLGFMVPTLKIASNTALSTAKPHWIDFNAGIILENGDFELAQVQLIEQIFEIANGAKTKNELNQIREFAIWKNGVTL